MIHQHSASRLHWDLRLEHDGVLASWAVPKGMPEEPGENRFAAHTEDHPISYLDFHGEIPKGNYGAGTMEIWDQGTYEPLKWEPRKVEVRLDGERLQARYALFPIDKEDPPKDWMIHRMDPPADPGREAKPERIVPMLARTGELPADDERWGFEIKWDGVRAIAYCAPGDVRLESRNLKEISDSYPELGRLDRALGSHQAVLDGEIVAFDTEGRPNFGLLQQRMHIASREHARRLSKQTPVSYMIFDLLWLDGHSLMELPYIERRERLAGLQLQGEAWQTPEHVVGHGRQLLKASQEQHLEGVVAKRLTSPYEPGRRGGAWLKIKTFGRQEFVIGGWLPGKGKRSSTIGALLLGVYEADGSLRYVGRVGTGFSEKELQRLQRLLAPLRRERSPFGAGERPPRESEFVEPELVAEVDFAEWTSAGNIRHPAYKGLREDKPPQLVVREDTTNAAAAARAAAEAPAELRDTEATTLTIVAKGRDSETALVGGRELKLSNSDKVLYPETGFTKGQLIEYYVTVATVLLAHLRGRALTVTRWPDGVEGKSFFQKQSPAHRPEWVRTATLPAGSKKIDYTLADDLPTLVWLANLAAIELHTPLALRGGREPADLDGLRSRSGRGHRRARLRPPRPRPAGPVREPRPRELREDLGLQGDPGVRAAQRRGRRLRRHQDLREGRRRAVRAERARPCRLADDQGAPRGQGADRLEPERPQQDHRVRLLPARAAAPDGFDPARMGRGARGARRRRSRRARLRGERDARARRRAWRPVRARAVDEAAAARVRAALSGGATRTRARASPASRRGGRR